MAKDKLDKFIKEQLHDHRSPVDTDALWNRIEEKQARKKDERKRGVLWLIWGMSIMGIAISMVFFDQRSKISNYGDIHSHDDLETVINEEQNTLSKTVDSEFAETANPKMLTESINEFSQKAEKSNAEQSLEKPSFGVENSLSQKTKKSDNTDSVIASLPAEKSEIDDEKENILPSGIGKSDAEEPNKKIGETIIMDLHKEEVDEKEETIISEIADKANESKTVIGENVSERPLSAVQYLSLPTLNKNTLLWERPIESISGKALFELVSQRRYRRYGEKSWETSIALHAGYFVPNKTLSVASDSTANLLLMERERTETVLEGISGGFDLRFKHQSGFYGKLGLNYEQINERFEITVNNTETIIEDDVLLSISINSNGDSTSVFGEAPVTYIYDYQKKIYNSYRFIELPFSVGYTNDNGRLSYFLEAGLAFNLSFKQEGEILGNDLRPIDIEENSASIFRSNAGMSIMGGIGLSYEINDNLNFWLKPTFKYRPKSITVTEYALEQKYVHYGLNLGVRYTFK